MTDNELGDSEDIDRFATPQGMFTPRISVIHCTIFSRKHLRVRRDLLDMAFLDDFNSKFQNVGCPQVKSVGSEHHGQIWSQNISE